MTPAPYNAEAFSPAAQPELTVALLPWGDLIEDFLDSIGVSFETFCAEMTGGWLFGYVEALRLVGVRTVVVCFSSRVAEPKRFSHLPTGAAIYALPASRTYLRLRRSVRNPYGWTVEDTFGEVRRGLRPLYAGLRSAAPYLATPLRPLAQVLRRERCQAILCQEYEYARFDACVMLGKLLRIPVMATFQGGDWQSSCLEATVRPLTLRACAGLIIAPRTEVERVRDKYGVPAHKIARIFNPVDLALWHAEKRAETRAALGIPSTARVAAWHGRVDMRRKGLDVLLEAWQNVCRRSTSDVHLLLVGTGDDAGELRQRIVALGLQGVTWHNDYILERTAMRRYLSAADVYAFPSRHEGFPVAPLEAMACGLPVVAAGAPGVPDIFEGGEAAGGLVVPREDPAALARALERVLGDEAYGHRLGARARQRVEAGFSLSAVGEQLRVFLEKQIKR